MSTASPAAVGVGALDSAAPRIGRREGDTRARIRAANAMDAVYTVVLDDDPTGSQSVHGVPVLTRWADDDLRWAFAQPADGLFILTNTRGLGEPETAAVVREVAEVIARVAEETGRRYTLITRSDSTLRGHYPLETDVLADLARDAGEPYDALLIAPAYIPAGRVTAGDVQYVQAGDAFLPVGSTDYARDATFGFVSSDLKSYVEEKTNGSVPATEVRSISLEDIRVGGVERVRDIITSVHGGSPVIVNAVEEIDLDVVVLGLIEAERAGSRVLSRTGPSFVASRLGLERRLPLTHAEVFAGGERPGHGLVIVGSHVELTTRQLDRLLAETDDLVVVELDVPRLLDSETAAAELTRCTDAVLAALVDSDALLMSSRARVTGASGHSSLVIAQTVSWALSSITTRCIEEVPLKWVLAKGGITSSDVATEGLAIRRATIAGQLFPGIVSVWVDEVEAGHVLHGLPYVVFAGNVGDESTLSAAVSILRGAAPAD